MPVRTTGNLPLKNLNVMCRRRAYHPRRIKGGLFWESLTGRGSALERFTPKETTAKATPRQKCRLIFNAEDAKDAEVRREKLINLCVSLRTSASFALNNCRLKSKAKIFAEISERVSSACGLDATLSALKTISLQFVTQGSSLCSQRWAE